MQQVRRVALIFDNTARPETTGFYCRRALGRWLEVEHFLPTELGRIPRRGFDLYLNVDDGLRYDLPDALRPAAWWAIDTHLNFDWCLARAARFDHVFAAQRDGAEGLRAGGIASSRWLPLACDPEIHRRLDLPRERDVAFVGHEFPGPRAELLGRIRAAYPDSFVGRAFFDEMARVYATSRVVFNRSIRNDVNMRVFEALACGALLVTNDLAENGQDELFQPGTHLATYRDADELMATIARYLKDPAEARKVAAVGRREALANHTYRHRMEHLVDVVEGRLNRRAAVAVGGIPPADGFAPPEGADGFVSPPAPARPRAEPGYYGHARPELMALVPATARNVLDVGCGAGALGAALKARQGCRVVGIEYDPAAAELAAGRIDRVVVGDADELDPDFLPGEFDAVVCGDILEHLREPANLLRKARRWLAPGGTLVASIPNVGHRSVVGSLLAGNWTYESAGLLDRDHVRFFTRREAEKLVARAGFRIDRMQVVPGPGDDEWLAAGRPGAVDLGAIRLDDIPPERALEFHAYQFLVAAVPDEAADRRRGLTSIVILTHNELPYTRMCVDSVERFTDLPYELIFVDNASTDGTVEFLRTIPGATVIANAANVGFPAGANQGAAAARGDQVLFLNNDTVATTGWLDRLVEALDRDPTIGLVGPSSNCVGSDQQVDVSYRDLADLDGFAWDFGRHHDKRVEPSTRLIGFCLLVRRATWDDVGGFDERFGIGNYEDDDLCRRAIAAGWRAVIARDAFVHHFGSRTFVGSGADLGRIMDENRRRFEAKWAAAERPPEREAEADPGPAAEAADHRPEAGSPNPAPFAWAARAEGRDGGRPMLSACLIVRDNEDTLPACLASIRPWVDELVVVDTGSVDATARVARDHGARVFEFPWVDSFAAARNESFRRATGDWLFWMDSDDTIPADCGRRLRELVDRPIRPEVLGFVMQVHCPGGGPDGAHDVTVVDHIKLVRNRPDLRFEFRIHEQILPSIRRAGGEVEWTDLHVVHSGSDPGPAAQGRKRRRDLHLLRLEDGERPDHPFTQFNLGMTHVDGRDFAAAVGHLRRSIALSEPGDSHVRKAYSLLVYALSHGGEPAPALAAIDEALALFPDDEELRFRRGVLLHDAGRVAEAAGVYEDLLGRPDARHFTSVDRGIGGFKARQNLAVAYEGLGRPDLAAAQWGRITEDEPGYRPGWRGLVEALLGAGRPDEAGRAVDRLRRGRLPRAEADYLAGQVAAARGQADQALAFLRAAAGALPDDPEPARALGRVLFEAGRAAEAEPVLAGLARIAPDDAPTWHNLGALRLGAGRAAEALADLRASLRIRPGARATMALLAEALAQLDRPDEARAAWEQVLKDHPDDAEAAARLAAAEPDPRLVEV